MSKETFTFPVFYDYPPYFTLQPVKETRVKQSHLWGQLILSYCKYHNVFIIDVEEDFPVFANTEIKRKLNREGQIIFLDDLVSQGKAEWLDKAKRKCLILWKKVEDWAAAILNFVKTFGLQGSVMTVDELSRGDDVRGTELYGLDRELLMRALKLLETQGKARLFKGSTPEEEGVKFL